MTNVKKKKKEKEQEQEKEQKKKKIQKSCTNLAAVLQAGRGDESLDLGGFGVSLLALDDGSADYIGSDIILLVQVEQGTDLGGTLGTKAAGLDFLGEALEEVQRKKTTKGKEDKRKDMGERGRYISGMYMKKD